MIGIYKITSPSGKVYIGQSVNIKSRIRSYKSNNCKSQTAIYSSLVKYGFENHLFEVIEECETISLNERERYWQDFYDSTGKNGLNCRATKHNDKSGYFSEQTKLKMSESSKNKKLSEEHKKKIGDSSRGKKRPDISEKAIGRKMPEYCIRRGEDNPMFGKKHTEESRKKMSESQKIYFSKNKSYWFGKKNPKVSEYMKNIKKEDRPFYGKHLSDEHKEKLRVSNLGKKRSEETKKNASIAAKKRCETHRHPMSKYVLHLEMGVFFETAKEASETFGIKKTTLVSMLGGYNKNRTSLIYV